MKLPCPVIIDGCPDVDSPITNVSAEAPDPMVWAGTGWTPYRPVPILGIGPTEIVDCDNVSWSTVSQTMADLIAKIAATYCPPHTSDDPTAQEFYNDRQTATVECPNGTVYWYSIEAGTVISGPMTPAAGAIWKAQTNAAMLAKAQQAAIEQRVCIDVPGAPGRAPQRLPQPHTDPKLSANPGWCCTGGSLIDAENTYTIAGPDSYIFSVAAGMLAPGTFLHQTGPRTAVVLGVPSTPGIYSYTIRAVNTATSTITAQVTDTLYVMGILNSRLSDGTLAVPYLENLVGFGGDSPYNFVLLGTLPPGLTMGTDGTIIGTPTVAGTYSFSVKIIDHDGAVCTQTVRMTINPVAVPGPEWDNTIWEPLVYVKTLDATAVGAGAGADFVSESQGNSGACHSFLHGNLAYAGGAANCNVHVGVALQIPWTYCIVRVEQHGVTIFEQVHTFDAVGSYDFPFVVPGAGDLYITITNNTGPGGRMTFTGTFSNIP